MVEPTHLKNILVKLYHFPTNRNEHLKKWFETKMDAVTPPRKPNMERKNAPNWKRGIIFQTTNFHVLSSSRQM